jgi:aromatic ring-opening dioxygenase catalytic subunit (LigB family)
MARLPTYFISHGGGPWPWLKKEMPGVYDTLEASLADMPRQIATTPKAILMISGHWEERDFTVMANPKPPMVYDYYGFPDFTYSIQYDAPGSPAVAERVRELLDSVNIRTQVDTQRGFDHGTFAPMAAIYPNADVPVLQLSIRADYNVDAHLAAGRALAPLRDENVLIIGSGLSYHNLRMLGPSGARPSHEFDRWLTHAVCSATGEARNDQLRHWQSAPSARIAHPQEDHLIPLMVATGAAEMESATRVYHEPDFFGAIAASSFRFGG